VFARHGLNETVSFIAAWAIVLDYTILVAVTALTVPSYLAAFWAPLGRGGLEMAVALAVIGFVAADNLLGVTPRRLRRRIFVTAADLAVQAIVIVVGFAVVFDPHRLTQTIHSARLRASRASRSRSRSR
jgi:APA family basic amino acid/polyamine antiporter